MNIALQYVSDSNGKPHAVQLTLRDTASAITRSRALLTTYEQINRSHD
jgi:hypothetical protein